MPPQLEKTHVVPTSSQDEALARDGVSRMRVKEDSEKAGLKLNIKKTKVMASAPSLLGKKKGKRWKQ